MKRTLRSLGALLFALNTPAIAAPVQLVEQPPAQITQVSPGVILVDFGWAAFGNVRLAPLEGMTARIALPVVEGSTGVFIGKKPIAAKRDGSRWVLDEDVSGKVSLQVR